MKKIFGYDMYSITKKGRVVSKKRNTTKGGIIKEYIDKYGYSNVCLLKNGKKKTFRVHRLVAEAFISTINTKPHVNHIDGNKQNNSVENLEWCNQSENMQHAWDTGLSVMTDKKMKQIKELGGLNKVKVSCYKKDGKPVKTFSSISEAVDLGYGKQIANISHCLEGRRKTHNGYIWQRERD